ncbi:MAG: hypothetical protein RR903_13735, partial [Edwardsiella sp. (in: enterobacteria)]
VSWPYFLPHQAENKAMKPDPAPLLARTSHNGASTLIDTLLALGVKNIYTGPTAPGFLTDNLLAILNQRFGMRGISTVDADLNGILGHA